MHRHLRFIPGMSFQLPELRCKAPFQIHPDYPDVCEQTTVWVDEFLPFSSEEDRRATYGYQFPMFVAMIHPDGITSRVATLSCVSTLLFEVDDFALVARALFEDVASFNTDEHPYAPAFADLRQRLEREMSPTVRHRYQESWQRWFVAAVEEGRVRSSRVTPELDECMRLRRGTVAVEPAIVGVEHLLDYELSDAQRRDPDFNELWLAVQDHSILVNDLYSLRKEIIDGEVVNVVVVLYFHGSGHLQAAVNEVCEMIAETDDRGQRAAKVLRKRYPDQRVHCYVDAVLAIKAGNLRWGMETPRYNGEKAVWRGLRSGTMTFFPERTDLDRTACRDPEPSRGG